MNRIAFDGTKVRKVLEQIESKYGLKLPRTVITIDYDEDIGDL